MPQQFGDRGEEGYVCQTLSKESANSAFFAEERHGKNTSLEIAPRHHQEIRLCVRSDGILLRSPCELRSAIAIRNNHPSLSVVDLASCIRTEGVLGQLLDHMTMINIHKGAIIENSDVVGCDNSSTGTSVRSGVTIADIRCVSVTAFCLLKHEDKVHGEYDNDPCTGHLELASRKNLGALEDHSLEALMS
jgi:hypothetical protein